MEKNQTVIGSYQTEDEAIRVIKRLLSEGYLKDEITIFTNPQVGDNLSNPEHVDVAEPDLNGNDEDGKNDQSFWQSVKDAFKVRDKDFYNDPNYTSDDDLLHTYRDDLERGNIVVVVDNYHGTNPDDEATELGTQSSPGDGTGRTDEIRDPNTAGGVLGTSAGFPDEGGVVGMGDGGQPPVEPNQAEGTPPELEDTDGEADSDELKEERLKNTDDEFRTQNDDR